MAGQLVATDSAVRARIRRSVQSPSGRAVLAVLRDNLGAPLTATQIAERGCVSVNSARDQAYRLAQLGWARQTTARTGAAGSMPAMAWQVTPRGMDYCAAYLERSVTRG